MFVCVARVTIDIPAAGSLKGKRQVLRRVTDRVKAKFNVATSPVLRCRSRVCVSRGS